MKSQTHDSTKVWLHDGASLYIQTSPLAQPCPLSYWSANGETSAKSVRANFPTFNPLHLDTFQTLLWEGRLLGCGRYSGAACTIGGIVSVQHFLWEETASGSKASWQGADAPKEISFRGVQTNQQTVQEGCKRVKSCSKQLEKLS